MTGKNLAEINGKPLVAFPIDVARAASDITRVLVTTDDDQIEAVARSYSAEIFRHPPVLSTESKPTFPVIKHVVETLISQGYNPDAVVIMRATSPLTLPEDVSAAIELLEQTGATSVISVVADETGHPIRLKLVGPELQLLPLQPGEENAPIPRQQLPIVYKRNGSLYATKTGIILTGSLFGGDPRAYIMPKERSVSINDEVDLVIATALINYLAQK
ncbi:MAG: acylneuraminate cytidylyltransferase family protein [Candidatus Chisholmbacteria bacterium]|nr:acylneuraminate cytidylyltransferase family protein [Candidatus Chisholmbacteria bacterium]